MGIGEVELFAYSTTLRTHNKSITVVRPMYVAVAAVKGCLLGVPEEPAKFAKANDYTWTKVKPPEAVFNSDIDVEVSETVVSIKIEPLESAFCRITLQVDMRCASHGYQSICSNAPGKRSRLATGDLNVRSCRYIAVSLTIPVHSLHFKSPSNH